MKYFFTKPYNLLTHQTLHNDPSNANIHTQSTRTSQFGGGSHGGLDDRFDFILFSDSLMYGDRIFVIDSTYKSFGKSHASEEQQKIKSKIKNMRKLPRPSNPRPSNEGLNQIHF